MVKNNITISALRLFLQRGYKYVSIIDVANEVGMTKGGIYHYFASKKDLLSAAVEFLFDNLKQKNIDLFHEDNKIHDVLRSVMVDQVVNQYVKQLIGVEDEFCLKGDENFIIEVIQNFPDIDKRIDEDFVEICAAIEKNLRKAVARKEIRADLDVNALAKIIWTMLQGQNAPGLFLKDNNSRVQIMENFCKLLSV